MSIPTKHEQPQAWRVVLRRKGYAEIRFYVPGTRARVEAFMKPYKDSGKFTAVFCYVPKTKKTDGS